MSGSLDNAAKADSRSPDKAAWVFPKEPRLDQIWLLFPFVHQIDKGTSLLGSWVTLFIVFVKSQKLKKLHTSYIYIKP